MPAAMMPFLPEPLTRLNDNSLKSVVAWASFSCTCVWLAWVVFRAEIQLMGSRSIGLLGFMAGASRGESSSVWVLYVRVMRKMTTVWSDSE